MFYAFTIVYSNRSQDIELYMYVVTKFYRKSKYQAHASRA
jgi:hypothetical protein